MPSVSQTCSSTSRSIRFEISFFRLLKSTACVQVCFHELKSILFHDPNHPAATCLSDLKALQKDVLTNASALNEVITSTKKFLEENRSKLTPEQIAILESKLEEAKNKARLINQRAEESRKDLEKVVTTAIKQESEKVRVQIISIYVFCKNSALHQNLNE